MSDPEYYQRAEDHRSILILIKFLNFETDLEKSKQYLNIFNSTYKSLSNFNEIKLNIGNLNHERIVRLRFKKNVYESQNNDWGDFQAHRKLLGLITIGILEIDNLEKDLNSNENQNDKVKFFYEKHKESIEIYNNTLLDSRCLLLKLNRKKIDEKMFLNKDNESELFNITENEIISKDVNGNDSHNTSLNNNLFAQNCQNTSLKSINCHIYNVNYYENNEDENDSNFLKIFQKLENELQELVSSLFYVLESKRLDKSYEKQEKIPLLLAPFENKFQLGLDTDSKIFKKKSLGRMRKQIGDLSLLVGCPSDALINYSVAIELLMSACDFLWLSSTYEGQCVASLLLLYPKQISEFINIDQENHNLNIPKRQNSFKKIFSLPSNKLKNSNFTFKNYFPKTDLNNSPLQNSSESTLTNENLKNFRSSKTNLKKKFLSSTSILNSGKNSFNIDSSMYKILGKSLLSTDEEIYEKYKEACCNYAKFKEAAIIELECSLKATRVLASKEKYLQASEFIQNAVFISLGQNHEKNVEKVMEKASIIGQLYEEIGFRRKSAFYQRYTALQFISSKIDKLEKSNWEKCYYSLLPSIFGYHLTLDPLAYERRINELNIGWTNIHLQMLQEMIYMSKKMCNDQLTMRHLSFLLQALFEFLPINSRKEFAIQLEKLSSKCGEGAPVLLTLNNGFTIPSVNLTKFPLVTKFEIKSYNDYLRPIKIKTKRQESSSNSILSSPFIFTPMQINRPLNNRRKSINFNQSKLIDFHLIQNELCTVSLEVFNPLPIELKVNHMALMTGDSIAFETNPISFNLPPESGPVSIKLTGKPKESGKLEIIGYTSHVLGVKNNCKLNELPYAKKMKLPSKYIIEIISSLPLLTITTYDLYDNKKLNNVQYIENDKQKIKIDSNKEACSKYYVPIKLLAGETRDFKIKLENCSKNNESIEFVNIKTTSHLSKKLESKIISFNEEDIFKKLPFVTNSFIEFNVKLFGVGDFIHTISETDFKKKIDKIKSTSPANTIKKSQNTLGSTIVNFLSDFQSTPKHNINKYAQSVKNVSLSLENKYQSKKLEITLEFEYSGGNGLISGYCRQTQLIFVIEISSCLLITKWDVLPAVVPTHCYLVFDILNTNINEVELEYSLNKTIIIESKETCRIPVPVERCSLISTDHCVKNLQKSLNLITNTMVNYKENLVEKMCRKHLKNQVKLNWKIVQSQNKEKIQGVIKISKVPWTATMLNSILMCSIQFKICINEIKIKTEHEFCYKIGQVITINIQLTNWRSSVIKSLALMVECFQDLDNGNKKYDLDMKRGILGNSKINIDEIQSQHSLNHEVKFIFFYTGIYKIDIRCLCSEPSSLFSENDLDLNICQEAIEWRFNPTFEFKIVE